MGPCRGFRMFWQCIKITDIQIVNNKNYLVYLHKRIKKSPRIIHKTMLAIILHGRIIKTAIIKDILEK